MKCASQTRNVQSRYHSIFIYSSVLSTDTVNVSNLISLYRILYLYILSYLFISCIEPLFSFILPSAYLEFFLSGIQSLLIVKSTD